MLLMMVMVFSMIQLMIMTHSGPGLWVLSQALLLLYFYLDNGSNVCGLEFNYKNEEQEGDSDNKSLLGADKAEHETFYNDQIFRQLFLGFEVRSEKGRSVYH